MGGKFSTMACGYPPTKSSLQQPASFDTAVAAKRLDDAPSAHADMSSDDALGELKVVVGTSQMMKEDSTLVSRISNFSGKWEGEVRSRMSYGDGGSERANRVMHVAFLNGVAVGWCSSSTAGWGGDGHWGALAVDPAAQGRGIASALVAAAEKRLLDGGCDSVQIEYNFRAGDPAKERLYAWYEGKLGFYGGPKRSGFRCCHKDLSWEAFRVQHATSLNQRQYCGKLEAPQVKQGREGKRSRSYSSSASSSRSTSPGESPASQHICTQDSESPQLSENI
jgi:GNAT superfamily N-acetyltransferase